MSKTGMALITVSNYNRVEIVVNDTK